MNDITTPLDKRWIWTAALGLVFFLIIQVFPVTGQLFTANVQHVMTRSEAENTAIATVAEKFGIRAEDIDKTTVTHISDSKTTGYFAKYELTNDYDKKWSEAAPTDVYVVELFIRGIKGALALSLNMENGKLVAWQHIAASSTATAGPSGNSEELAKLALEYAATRGIDTKQWEWTGITSAKGFEYASRQESVGEAELRLRVLLPASLDKASSSFPTWQGGAVTYGVNLPADFMGYMKTQERWAANLSVFGFILPQIILFILAIIYAGTHSGHTSFRRGIFLSVAFFVLYAGLTFNMIPGLRAGTWDSGVNIGDNVNLVVSLVTYAAMALLTYFSAVGGDGLWKSMGRALWPRWKEAGYGAAVLRSMREGYFLAFILLGAQSLILLALEKSLGSFSASDATQSMYNMSFPLLLPLLAWCAGISEELQSRLFGIGLFRKWFVGIARKITGKEPSGRTAIVLTTFAIVPPGLMWALGHVGYAVYPVYTRLIELVLMSFLFGWFMLRFGIMTVIFAHVTLDAILMGIQMMFDGLPGDFAGGVFSFILPGIVGIIIWRLHGALRMRS
ncbi:CPBP family intramembrane glutamic endopeptidase [Cohnella terricola]|uniref:CPBP family intramembrane metalloprotease n=1 Tax=Cohnella terricola TaxID=1289167 RepID=A0A559JFV9_9BACL|nr:CPBP family intramembrane glutamic endopeptidase [Cohnella terricola]TVX98769.1 CPBP family intramembrane metalloprotease [Cohnella terricola]